MSRPPEPKHPAPDSDAGGLVVERLGPSYRKRLVLRDVTLSLRQGEVAALLEGSVVGRFLASPSGAMFGGVQPLVAFAEALGDLYVAAGERLALIEINPLRLVPGQATPIILDALLASKGRS